MPGRGRGRIAGSGRGRGAGAVQANNPTVVRNDVPDDSCACGLCSLQVGDEAVGCDDCPLWFHPSPRCMGISEASISAIVSEGDGGGLRYVCTKCRVENHRPGGGGGGQDGAAVDKAAISQLFMTVRSLAASVASLVQQMSGLAQRLDNQASSDVTQDLVRKEVIEWNEREKRKHSIILKGLTATTVEEATAESKRISTRLLGYELTFVDMRCIDINKHIFRAKVVDDNSRRDILTKAKMLKDIPELSSIYIHRDLTYYQRQVLFERRAAARNANNQGEPQGQTSRATNL